MLKFTTWRLAVDGGVSCPSEGRPLVFSGVVVFSDRKPFKASVDRFFFNCCERNLCTSTISSYHRPNNEEMIKESPLF